MHPCLDFTTEPIKLVEVLNTINFTSLDVPD